MKTVVTAISDLHVGFEPNAHHVEGLRPTNPSEWLIVAGDVAEKVDDIEATLRNLARHFERVIWTPGNHELWVTPSDRCQDRGTARYEALVAAARRAGALTPEDPFPILDTDSGPVVIAPLFLLYDGSFAPRPTPQQAAKPSKEPDVQLMDDFVMPTDPHPDAAAWCRQRVAETAARLDELDPDTGTLLINHYPLNQDAIGRLRYPEIVRWSGTALTADWHLRYRARATVYGHFHMPGTVTIDNVPFHEVSLGYPRERKGREPNRPVVVLEGSPVS